MSGTALRIRRVQKALLTNDVDGFLLVMGGDGGYKTTVAEALKFLLGPAYCLLEDDGILLITKTGVSVWANSHGAAAEVSEQLSPLPHQIFVPSPEEASDPDKLEDNKLGSFVQMLRACTSLAMPLSTRVPAEPGSTAASSSPAQLQGQALMELESLPLLQAYGLDGVGRPGFFTQCFKVFDLPLHSLYATLDGTSMQGLLDQASTLHQHWMEMTKVLSSRPPAQQALLTERQVAEPLLGYFSYGMLRPAPGTPKAVVMQPRVVFGPARTNDEGARSEGVTVAAAGAGAASGASAGDTQGGQQGAVHFVAEAADPRSALRAARTYFLSAGALVKDIFADPDEEEEEGYSFEKATAGWTSSDALFLMRTYAALVDAAQAGIQHFATQEGATVHSARSVVLETLATRCEALGVVQPSLATQLRFALWQADHTHTVTPAAQRTSRQLKVLRVSLLDVQSRSTGALLGGLVYADTFLEVPTGDGRYEALILTEAIPHLLAYGSHGPEGTVMARALRTFTAVAMPPSGTAPAAAAVPLAATAAARSDRRTRKQQRVAHAAARHAAAVTRAKRAEGSQPAGQEGGDEGTEDASRGQQDQDRDPAKSTEAPHNQDLQDGDDGDDDEEEEEDVGNEHLQVSPAHALGRLLTLGGGDEAVLLTGCPTCPAIPGSLLCFTEGIAFVSSATKTLWTLSFLQQVEAITLQELGPPTLPGSHSGKSNGHVTPGASSSARTTADAAAAPESAIGEVVVFRGKSPACGLPPVCHLTSNMHIAISLQSMSQVARKHMLSTVLPAFQQTCREAGGGALTGMGSITYLKDPHAHSPFPPDLHLHQLLAVQALHEGHKVYRTVAVQDQVVERRLQAMDDAELCETLPEERIVRLLLGLNSTEASGKPVTRSIPLTLVVGLPGSEQVSVGAGLLSVIGVEHAPRMAVVPAGCSAAPLTVAEFEAALTACTGSLVGHAVLVTSSLTPLTHQLSLLADSVPVRQGAFQLASVVAVVSSDTLWADVGRGVLLPGLQQQIPRGYVDAVVLAGSTRAADVQRMQQVVQSLDPGVALVRGSGVPSLMRARAELLPPREERIQRLQASRTSRLWALPPAGTSGNTTGMSTPTASCCPTGLADGPVTAVRLVFTGEVDVSLLKQRLSQDLHLGSSPPVFPPIPLAEVTLAGPAKQAPRGVLGWGVVRTSLGATAQEVRVSHHSPLRALSCALLGAQGLVYGAPEILGSDVKTGGELVIVGTGLSESALSALVAECGQGAVGAVSAGAVQATGQVRTRQSLTPAERASIRKAHEFDDLPEGWFYDGSGRYVDAFGDSQLDHPDMDRFIEEYLAAENTRLAAESQAAAVQAATQAAAAPRVTLTQSWVLSS